MRGFYEVPARPCEGSARGTRARQGPQLFPPPSPSPRPPFLSGRHPGQALCGQAPPAVMHLLSSLPHSSPLSLVPFFSFPLRTECRRARAASISLALCSPARRCYPSRCYGVLCNVTRGHAVHLARRSVEALAVTECAVDCDAFLSGHDGRSRPLGGGSLGGLSAPRETRGQAVSGDVA